MLNIGGMGLTGSLPQCLFDKNSTVYQVCGCEHMGTCSCVRVSECVCVWGGGGGGGQLAPRLGCGAHAHTRARIHTLPSDGVTVTPRPRARAPVPLLPQVQLGGNAIGGEIPNAFATANRLQYLGIGEARAHRVQRACLQRAAAAARSARHSPTNCGGALCPAHVPHPTPHPPSLQCLQNKLTGSIPPTLANAPSLIRLTANNNSLSGGWEGAGGGQGGGAKGGGARRARGRGPPPTQNQNPTPNHPPCCQGRIPSSPTPLHAPLTLKPTNPLPTRPPTPPLLPRPHPRVHIHPPLSAGLPIQPADG